MFDPYRIGHQTIKEPPTTFREKLRFLGPGFILSASIVGSGELIATTVLGAKAGFSALWIIILSCLVKVAVQLEFGKHTVLTGETAMQAFSQLPGPKFGRARWAIWTVLVLTIPKVVQIGGILGGTAIVMHMLISGVSIQVWAVICALVVGALIYNGKYNSVEKISLLMMAMFTVLTLTSLFSLRYTSYQFTLTDVVSGLHFHLSADLILFAIGAFGITGVASDEIIAYTYWCIEKGYASYTGPREETPAWRKRAEGWLKVMYLDAVVAMVIYTIVTVAFYLLGAAVLRSRAEIPMGNEVIETLALIYTQSLGNGIKTAYLVGAFFVLFSSLYATLAFWTRLLSDVLGQVGWIDFWNREQRKKTIAALAWVLPIIWATVYLFIELPVIMVLSGGVVGSILLFLVVFAAYQFKYRRHQDYSSGWFYNIAFWVSVVAILAVGVYGLLKVFE